MSLQNGFDPDFASAADWANQYRAHGIQVMPCKGKIPARPWTQHQNGLMSQDQFNRWYGTGGEFVRYESMGMLTGAASGHVLMIDLDLYKPNGAAAMNWWLMVLAVHNNGSELETWEQVTGGGGRQMFFTYPPGWRGAVNSKTDLCVDTRGQGGFAVLPPSRHASGNFYRWKDGRSPWEVPILAAPEWLLEEVERLVRDHGGGQVVEGHFQPSPSNGTLQGHVVSTPGAQFDPFGHKIDFRETYMRDLVWAAFIGFRDECPIPPGAVEERRIWEDYERNVEVKEPITGETKLAGLEREKRGPTVFHVKWNAALAKWDSEELAEAVRKRRELERVNIQIPPKPEPGHNTPDSAPVNVPETGKSPIFELLDIDQIENIPDPVWLVNDLVIDHSLGFIYGPPSSLKTFIALDLALSFTTRQVSWWGRDIQRHGAVIYICNEGIGSLKFRIRAWQLHHNEQVSAATTPFFLIRQPLDFMNASDIGTLLATVEEGVKRAGVPIAAVFVDTLSKVLPGAEENQQKDMSLFMKACGLIRDRFCCVVFGIHHTNANGGFRGSTVMPGAGDFMIETRREPGAMSGSIFAKKIKDADDGWEQTFKVTKVIINNLTGRTSLAVDPDGVEPRSQQIKEELPPDAVREQILTEIDRAWLKGKPWTHSGNTPRGVVTFMTTKWKISKTVAKKLLDIWTAHGIIEHGIRDPKNHVSGYKRLIKTGENGGESNA